MNSIDSIKDYIIQNYGLNSDFDIELLAGEGNSVYLISKDTQQMIFRIFSLDKDIEVIKSEIELLCFFSSNRLNTEIPLRDIANRYHSTIKIDNVIRHCAMYKALRGNIFDEIISEEQAYKLGCLTGKLHNITDLYMGQSSFKSFGYNELVDMPLQIIKPYIQHNIELYSFYETITKGSGDSLREKEQQLSWGLCHGDLHAGNVIFDQLNEPGLFDFDLSCKGWRLYDIATFIWSILPREDYSEGNVASINNCIDSFLNGYKEIRQLTTAEYKLIFNIVLLRHIWRQADRINFDKTNNEWKSELHFVVQAQRMKKWIELYEIKL